VPGLLRTYTAIESVGSLTGTLWAVLAGTGFKREEDWNRRLSPNGVALQPHRTPSARFASTARPALLHGTCSSLNSTAAILRPQISVSLGITACEQSRRVSKLRSSQRHLPTFPDRRLQAFRASPVRANSLAHFWSGMLIKITATS
jgi:hypothetical protein